MATHPCSLRAAAACTFWEHARAALINAAGSPALCVGHEAAASSGLEGVAYFSPETHLRAKRTRWCRYRLLQQHMRVFWQRASNFCIISRL